ncbi:MAG: acyltransferase domain-containing protein, partial [Nannocystaceae bacterium]
MLSARTEAELRVLADRSERALAGVPEGRLVDACAAAAGGRARLEERLAVVAPSLSAARARLSEFAQGEGSGALRGRASSQRPRVALLFSGQGSQHAGMARGLLAWEPTFRATIERCDALFGDRLGPRLLEVLDPDHPASRRIDETGLAQPAIFAVEVALAGLLRGWGVEPCAVLGHSVGELAAACFVGALSLEDAVELVVARAAGMQALPPGGSMAAAFTDEATVRAILGDALDGDPAPADPGPPARGVRGAPADPGAPARGVRGAPADPGLPGGAPLSIAAINAADEVVLSGDADALDRALERLGAAGVRTRRLHVSHAFHSRRVEPMLDAFAASLAGLRPRRGELRLISGLTGAAIDGEALDAGYWRRHARAPVRFADGVRALLAAGAELVVEVGPHPVLLPAARRGAGEAPVQWWPTLRRDRDDASTLLAAAGALFVAGVDLDPARLYAGRPRRALALPTYPFARERHWVDAGSPATPGRVAAVTAAPERWFQGAPIESPALAGRVFAHTLTAGASAVLREHRVFGVNVISGAVQGTLLAAAAAATLGEGTCAFEGIRFQAPLILEGDALRAVQVVVEPEAPGVARLRLHSHDGERWIEHCAATARAGALLPTEAVDLAAIRGRCGERIDGDAYYARGWPPGVHELGPAFRSIVTVWRRDGEALAEVRLRADAGDAAEDPAIRACRLGEVSGQILGAALPGWDEHGDRTAIGLGIGRSVDAAEAAPAVVYWHARVRGAPGEGGVIGDVQMLTAEGRVLRRAEGLELGWVRREQLRWALTQATRRVRATALTRAELASTPAAGRRARVEAYLRGALAAACGGA